MIDMASGTVALAPALAIIERHTVSIEQAFLQAGESLGRGLDTFDGITGDLNGILEDLGNGSMGRASAALDRLSVQLGVIGEGLPRDAAILDALLDANGGIAQHLDRLREHIRMMTIIARSARIEAVVFGATAGLDSFTEAMERLTRGVGETVGHSCDAHARLVDRLRQVAGAQTALDRDFRDRLIALAADLSETFGQIADRQARGVDLMGQVATRSSAIAGKTGLALMALQSGDATRQRLEHVSAALRLAGELGSAERGSGLAVPAAERDTTAAVMIHLQACQLRDLAAGFAQDAGDIDALLGQLLHDTAALVGDGRAVLGGNGRSSESFLAAFRTRLADAAGLVETCERARGEVDRATLDLRTQLIALSRAMSDLGATTMDLIMLGINAGLKAARLGLGGRSLMVIADELKRLAALISTDATALVGMFASVQQTSRRLDRTDTANAPDGVDAEIRSIGHVLEASDMRVAALLDLLEAKTQSFETDLAAAREQFRAIAAGNADLLGTADALNGTAVVPEGAAAIAAPHLETLLQPAYTMARERDIHAEVLGSAPLPTDAAAAEFDIESLLFEEAV